MEKTSILICEDEMIVALDIKSTLEQVGYHVIGIASGPKEAVELASRHNPDLAIMDINLGSWADGIETAKVLKKHFNTPVVFVTGNADVHTVERAMETKPVGFLTKPFDDLEFYSTISYRLDPTKNKYK